MDDVVRYGYQCLICYDKSGQYLKNWQLQGIELGLIDDWDEQSWHAKCEQRKQQRSNDREAWHAKHRARITDDDWKQRIRPLVFERANGKCEGCGIAAATQVHHVTYEHLGDEFLFELRALCDKCHERISGKVVATDPQFELE